MNLTSSGVFVMSKPEIMEFIATDFPVPVAPATKRCGILPKSRIIVFPEISFPRIKGSSYLSGSFLSLAIISLM